MREQYFRKGIVEKTAGVIGAAEGTVGQGGWAVGEVQTAAIDRGQSSSKGIVKVRQYVLWSQSGKSGVQDVGGRMKARGGQGPQVLRREIWESRQGSQDRCDEEDIEGMADVGWHWTDWDRRRLRLRSY
jgi:hypothetical protein